MSVFEHRTAVIRSCTVVPTLLIIRTLEPESIAGCHVDATDDSNRCMPIKSSACAKTIHPIFDHQVRDTTIEVIKSIQLNQLFLFKSQFRLRANPVLQRYLMLRRCTTHSKHTYSVVQTIEKKVCNLRGCSFSTPMLSAYSKSYRFLSGQISVSSFSRGDRMIPNHHCVDKFEECVE